MSDPATYTVGWICAIPTESVAARQFLDEEHDPPSHVSQHDNNVYTLGRIGQHRVVVAVLPKGEYGTTSAASVARDMLHSFPNVRIGLMVGIGGGAPSKKHDIRLGDVVVSSPQDGRGGVLQYDYGKAIQGHGFQHSGFLNQPQPLLRAAVGDLEGRYLTDGNQIHENIQSILAKKKKMKRLFQRPELSTDRLYLSTFVHTDSDKSCEEICNGDEGFEVDHCERLVKRNERSEDEDSPAVHYGLIASANTLMKNAEIRDSLAEAHGVLCFEMEAAGLMNHFPCLVIRGICDYSDSHKNKDWQGYAAMTAAAYARDLLGRIPPTRIEAEKRLSEILSTFEEKLNGISIATQETNDVVNNSHVEHHRGKINAWLSPPDPSTNYNKALKQRHEGSGRWFLQRPEYSDWKTERNSFLWLHGIPGCGKTVLSSTIVEDLEKNKVCSPLYFYFYFNDASKQSLENAVRSLINQLYGKRGDVERHIDSLYSSCKNGARQPSIHSLCKTFQDMVQQAGEVWIILDALDECQTRKGHSAEGLLSWIENIRSSQERNVHILATSRPEQDIKSATERWARKKDIIPIQSDLVAEDIRAYIHTKVKENDGLSRWKTRPDVQGEIESALTQKAHGMFRWVSCQLDVLENCLDYSDLSEALSSLPETLDETYARILENIPARYKDKTTRILQFLTFSERPLRIEEAVDVVAFQRRS
ncbi:Ankyrin repeat protein [Lasiodiplodia theobromae]|uniref:Ankyrin repeat protein n=1 Tax=Lasiodiplodia theobromae TaxID=45133 RepID=UPI0015C36BF9|nr:Ankyrin repeat protein [Lasiodiplodia theobromae]KAF4546475.1 Ankyrin repeat protein [Lasiodiplodia theobromae]